MYIVSCLSYTVLKLMTVIIGVCIIDVAIFISRALGHIPVIFYKVYNTYFVTFADFLQQIGVLGMTIKYSVCFVFLI